MGAWASVTLFNPDEQGSSKTDQESLMYFNRNRGSKPALRPLPSGMPEYIAVEITESEYKGRHQWVARYRLYNNDLESDFIDVVINVPYYFRPSPESGDRLWVRPTAMAPQKRLVFADAHERVRDHYAPLTVRAEEELVLDTFYWSRESRRYRAIHDGWVLELRDTLGICQGESWRVRVGTIYPGSGTIEVKSIGPHPKMIYEPPMKVGLMSVIPIFGKREMLEGDVLSCWRGWQDTQRGGQLHAEIEHRGRIIRLHCSELRKVSAGLNKDGRTIEKIVGLVSVNRAHSYLAELVLVEGETVQKPELAHHESQRSHRPVEEHNPLDEPDDYEGSQRQLEDEIRYNSDPPDYD